MHQFQDIFCTHTNIPSHLFQGPFSVNLDPLLFLEKFCDSLVISQNGITTSIMAKDGFDATTVRLANPSSDICKHYLI